MQLARPRFAMDPKLFGKGRPRQLPNGPAKALSSTIGADLKFFATTFVAGFLFVSILIS
jgi:hypothetical protein